MGCGWVVSVVFTPLRPSAVINKPVVDGNKKHFLEGELLLLPSPLIRLELRVDNDDEGPEPDDDKPTKQFLSKLPVTEALLSKLFLRSSGRSLPSDMLTLYWFQPLTYCAY